MRVTRWLSLCPVVAALGCATTESAAPANAASTGAAAVARPTVPEAIAAPASATLVIQLAAKGTQNYKCQSATAGGAEWKLVAPEAELSTIPGGAPAGTHGAGPSWTLTDGSGAKGDAANAKKAPSPEA